MQSAAGGIIAILIDVKQDTLAATGDDVITGAGPGAPGGPVK
jgi:hypothetical protein